MTSLIIEFFSKGQLIFQAMWRLKPLSDTVKALSAFPSKCQLPQLFSSCKSQLVRHIWQGGKSFQAASPVTKLKTGYSYQEGQEIEGFTVTEVGELVLQFSLFPYFSIFVNVRQCCSYILIHFLT